MGLWQRFINWYREKSGSYGLNFTKLVCGTAGGQILTFITLPILTHMYTVSDFGTQALYSSIVSILLIVVTGRYELAILLPKEDEESFAIVLLTILLAFGGSLVVESIILCLNFVLPSELIPVCFSGAIYSWLPFLAITIFVQVNYSVWYTWLNRNRAYDMMSRMAVISGGVNFLATFAYGYFTDAEEHGLLLNTFAGVLCCTVYMVYYCWKQEILPYKQTSLLQIVKMMRRYKRFPRFLIFGHVLNTGSTQLPIFILQDIGGQELVGLFAMVQRLLQIPISLISSAMGNVFIREASEAWQKYKSCWVIYRKTLHVLSLLGLVPFTIIFFVAGDLLPIVLGEKWRMAGVYVAYLCPMFYMCFVSSPLSSMFMITEKLKMDLLVQIVRFGIIYISMMGSFNLYETNESVIIAYGVAFTLFYIWNMSLTMKWAKGESYFGQAK